MDIRPEDLFIFGDHRKTCRNLWITRKMGVNFTVFIWQVVNETKKVKNPCRTASDANLLNDPHTFHCSIDYFVLVGIRTWLGVFQCFNVPVVLWEFWSNKFAACSKPPSRDNHRKALYRRVQQHDQGADGPNNQAIRAFVNTTPLPIRPCCRCQISACHNFPEFVESLPKKSIFILFVWA